MSYKYSKGSQVIGDLKAADDTQRDTLIDFGEDYIGFETSGSVRMVISGSDGKVGVGVSSPAYKLDVNGDIRVRGNDIRDNSGNKAISFDGSANTTVVNNLGVNGVTSPIAELDVAGKIAITAESSTPSQPSDGQGYLYTKSDGKIYWRSYDVSETDLTSGGGGGGSSPGGPDGAVQINDAGSLTGSAGFTYDGTEIYASASVAIVGDQRLHDPDFASDNERKRSFTYKSHRHFRLIPANNWTDVISWRPYKTGTTTDPEANSFYAVVGFRLEIHGSTGGVGAGSKSRVGYVAYNGSSANSANAADTSLGNPVSTRVNMSGWTTNLQINPNQSGASSFTGVVYVEVYFTRGEGSNGNNIEWSIT